MKKTENTKKDSKKKTSEGETKLLGLYKSLREMRFKTHGSKTKNVKEAKAVKKQIARILTEQNQK